MADVDPPANEPGADAPGSEPTSSPGERGLGGPTPRRTRPSEGRIWAPATAPGAWVPTPRRPRLDVTRPPGEEAVGIGQVQTIINLNGLTNVLLLAYGGTFVLLVAFATALARRRSAMTSSATVDDRPGAMHSSSHLLGVTATGLVAATVATIVVSAVWCWVAARNQEELAGEPTLPSPLAAAIGWLVPFVNLLVPFRTVNTLAEGPLGDEPVPPSVPRWWLAWLTAAGLTGASVWLRDTTVTPAGSATITVSSRALLLAVAGALSFLYCFSQANVVFRHIAARQHARAYGVP